MTRNLARPRRSRPSLAAASKWASSLRSATTRVPRHRGRAIGVHARPDRQALRDVEEAVEVPGSIKRSPSWIREVSLLLTSLVEQPQVQGHPRIVPVAKGSGTSRVVEGRKAGRRIVEQPGCGHGILTLCRSATMTGDLNGPAAFRGAPILRRTQSTTGSTRARSHLPSARISRSSVATNTTWSGIGRCGRISLARTGWVVVASRPTTRATLARPRALVVERLLLRLRHHVVIHWQEFGGAARQKRPAGVTLQEFVRATEPSSAPMRGAGSRPQSSRGLGNGVGWRTSLP
jgi:hypothetical protein